MSSTREIALAENIADMIASRKAKSIKQLLLDSGYKLTTAAGMNSNVIAQKGVQEHLAKLGFNEQTAKAVISEILLTGEEGNRLRAAQEVFKVTGLYAPERHITAGKIILEISAEIAKKNNIKNSNSASLPNNVSPEELVRQLDAKPQTEDENIVANG